MFYFTYLVSLVGAISLIGLKRRKPDLLTLNIGGIAYYSSELLFGVVYDPNIRKYVEINEYIYIFYSFLFLFFIFAVYINDSVSNTRIYSQKISPSTPEYFCFLIIVLVMIFLGLLLIDIRTFFPDEVGGFSASNYTSIYNIYWISVLLLIAAAFRTKSYSLKLIGLFFLLTTLLAGSRAYFLGGCLIALLMIYENKPPIRLFLSLRRVLVMILGFLFLIIYKNVYQYILMLDLDLLLEAGLDLDLLLFRLTKGSESIVVLNFQHAITLYSDNAGSFLDLVLIKCIPFISELYIVGFNFDPRSLSDILNENFYQNVSYGMASSIWGLFYYVSGPIGCLLFGFMYVLITLYLNGRILKKDMLGYHLIPPAVFIGFYATRLEIAAIVFPFYMSLFVLIIYKIIYTILPRKTDS